MASNSGFGNEIVGADRVRRKRYHPIPCCKTLVFTVSISSAKTSALLPLPT